MTTHHSEPEYRARIKSNWPRNPRWWFAELYCAGHFFGGLAFPARERAVQWACAELRRLADDVKVGGSE